MGCQTEMFSTRPSQFGQGRVHRIIDLESKAEMKKDARNLPKRVSTNDDITSPSIGGLAKSGNTGEERWWKDGGGGRMGVYQAARLCRKLPTREQDQLYYKKDEGGGGEGGGRRCC